MLSKQQQSMDTAKDNQFFADIIKGTNSTIEQIQKNSEANMDAIEDMIM